MPRASGGAAAAFGDADGDLRRRQAQRGSRGEQYGCEHGDDARTDTHAPIQAEAIQVRHARHHVRRDEPGEEPHGPTRAGEAERAAERDQEQSLGHELTDQSPARRPQRGADGQLTSAPLGANQQEARDVHARDQEQQSGAAEQHQQDGTYLANDRVGQGHHARALIAVGVGVLRFELSGDRLHLGKGSRDRSPILQPAYSVEKVAAAPQVAPARRVKRGPELSAFSRSELKVLRKDADDGVKTRVQGDRPADHVGLRAEAFLPGRVAENHRVRRVWQVFPGEEVAAERRHDAQRSKKPVAHARTPDELRARGRPQQVTASGVDIHRAEHGVEPLPVEIVGIGKVGARNLLRALSHLDEPVGIRVGQGLDQGGIDEAEDRRAGRDAKGQHEDGREREPGTPEQLPAGEPCVLHEVVDQVHAPRVAALFFALLDARDRPARLFGIHPPGDVFLHLAGQVIPQFLVELVLEARAGEERSKPEAKDAQHAHGDRSPRVR